MNLRPHAIVGQDFIWWAEYADGRIVREFDLQTKRKNSFYDIDKKSLIRFGLAGHGMKIYHEVYGGHFKVRGDLYDFMFRHGDEIYPLTGHRAMYNDVITYKDAESYATIGKVENGGRLINRITQFNTGFKKKLQIKDVNFSIRVLLCIPFDKPAYFLVRIVADKSMGGKLIMKKNGREVSAFDAPLRANVGGEMKFFIK